MFGMFLSCVFIVYMFVLCIYICIMLRIFCAGLQMRNSVLFSFMEIINAKQTLLLLFSVLSGFVFSCFCRISKVKNKGQKDIMAVEDMNGEVRFSAHLPYPNNLSRLEYKCWFLLLTCQCLTFSRVNCTLVFFTGPCWNRLSPFCRCYYSGIQQYVVENWILIQTSHTATQLYKIYSTWRLILPIFS